MKENLPNFIYIGPNATVLGLKKGTLYRGNEMPVQLKNLVQTNPKLASLFISTTRLGAAEVALKKQGSIEREASNDIIKLVNQIRQQRNRNG